MQPLFDSYLRYLLSVMHYDRYADFSSSVKLRHSVRRHVYATVASVAYPYAASERGPPVSIVEALSSPGDAQPVFYRTCIFGAVGIVASEHDISYLVEYVVRADIGRRAGVSAACHAAGAEDERTALIESYHLGGYVHVYICIADVSRILAVAAF